MASLRTSLWASGMSSIEEALRTDNDSPRYLMGKSLTGRESVSPISVLSNAEQRMSRGACSKIGAKARCLAKGAKKLVNGEELRRVGMIKNMTSSVKREISGATCLAVSRRRTPWWTTCSHFLVATVAKIPQLIEECPGRELIVVLNVCASCSGLFVPRWYLKKLVLVAIDPRQSGDGVESERCDGGSRPIRV